MHRKAFYFALILSFFGRPLTFALGEKVFEYSFGRELQTVPAVDEDGTIYVAGRGAVAALTKIGLEKWQIELSPGSQSKVQGVTVSDDQIYVASSQGLCAFDKTGRQLWVKDGDFGLSRVALDGPNNLYAVEGAQQAVLRAFKSDGTELWRAPNLGGFPIVRYTDFGPSIGPNGMIFTTAGVLAAFSRDGEELWTDGGFTFSAPPAVNGDGSIFYTPMHDPLYFVTYRIGPDGANMWDTGWITGTGGGSAFSAVVGPDKTLYLPTAETSSQNRGLIAFTDDGRRKWNFNDFSVLSCPAIAADGTIYIAGGNGATNRLIAAVSPEGAKVWTYTNGVDVVRGLAIGIDGSVLVAQTNGMLIALAGSSPLASGVWPVYGHDSRQTAAQRPSEFGSLRVQEVRGDTALFTLSGVPGEVWDIETSEDLRIWPNRASVIIHESGIVKVGLPTTSGTLFVRARKRPSF